MSGTTTAVTLTADMIGQTVTFRSKNANDQILYEGTIDQLLSYKAASAQDIVSYNAAVRQADPTVSVDLTSLHYFAIRLANTSGAQSVIYFAAEWIVSGSFVMEDLATVVTIEVYDTPSANHNLIVDLLTSGGYQSRITNIST